MSELMRQRIEKRLDAVGINRFEAERRAGLKRGYLNDFLIGKKGSIREKSVKPVAHALECDPEFLLGMQATPIRCGPGSGRQVSGIAELGAWRDPETADVETLSLPIPPDPRYPLGSTEIYLVRGDHAAGLGITDGSVVTVLTTHQAYRDGDIVLAKRGRAGTYELSVRTLAGGALSARPARGPIDPVALNEVDVVGLVISAIRVFGN